MAALVGFNPTYMPILDRLEDELRKAEKAALLAAPRRVVRGARLKSQAA